jgi:hypothetical protein
MSRPSRSPASRGSLARPVVRRLIAKDLYLYRWLIAGALAAGVASLALTGRGAAREGGFDLGFLLFLTTVIAFGVFVPMLAIFKERQDRTELFVLSLPLSPGQYARSKVVGALLVFLGPWLALTGGVVALTLASGRPGGGLPFFVATMGFLLGNFCTLTALVAVTRREIWAFAGILTTNVSVTPFLVYLGQLPGVAGRGQEAVAAWSPEVAAVLALEGLWICVALGLALWLPTRRFDFV